MLAIRAGQLIDGNGGAPLRNAVVLIKDSRIMQVGPEPEVQVPPDADVYDASNMTLMPGMVDAHVHIHAPGGVTRGRGMPLDQVAQSQGILALRAWSYAQSDLAMGFTTLRTVASPSYVDVALRDAINEGLVFGPRLLVCGQGITVTGGHMDRTGWPQEVTVEGRTGVGDGPWGMRKAARMQLKYGVDLLKFNAAISVHSLDYTCRLPYKQEMTFEEMAAICEEAHWAGKRAAAHAYGGPGVSDALRAGVDSIEHGPWLRDEHVECMVKQGTYYVPTLTVFARGWELGPEGTGSTSAGRNWLAQAREARWESLARAHAAGVKIAVGTDAGFWVSHGENARELQELVEGGFSATEAIVAATRTGAECLGMGAEIGTLEAGKFADMVIVDGDPLADVRILQDPAKIVQVFKGGQQVKAAE
jgi:imidazolonepropionase-like amidohydrolase